MTSATRSALALTAALALVLALLLAAPRPAAAQVVVVDPVEIADTTYWDYQHFVQFAYQIYQQGEQIANQIRQIDAQLRSLAKLPDPNWRSIQALLAQLDQLMRTGRALSYALADPGGQFRLLFPGWSPPWTNPTVVQAQATRALDTQRAGLVTIAQQAQSLAPGEDLLARIRQQMATTDGHQQALEQLTTLAAFSAQEQLLSRQSLAVANNLAAVAHAYWINRQAQADASLSLVMTTTSQAAFTSNSPGWTFTTSLLLP
jgi:P-type conjugative transfer protein TrbJ